MIIKLHCRAKLSKYGVFNLFVTQYISGLRNINIEYTRMTHFMSCLQYRHKCKGVIININIIIEKVSLDHMTFSLLGCQQHIARYLSLLIILIYDLILLLI